VRSALTPLQHRILGLLVRWRIAAPEAYVLTGGSALAGFDFGHRFTDDLDLFSRVRADVREDAEAVAQRLREEGLVVDALELRSSAFARIRLHDPESSDRLILDLGLDPHPIDSTRLLDDIPLDSMRDMAARKLVAFFERGEEEAKDAVDLYYLLTEGGWTLDGLITLARNKTADFDSADARLYLADLLIRCADPAYLDRIRRLRFTPDHAPDIVQMGRRLREEGERILLELGPEG